MTLRQLSWTCLFYLFVVMIVFPMCSELKMAKVGLGSFFSSGMFNTVHDLTSGLTDMLILLICGNDRLSEVF